MTVTSLRFKPSQYNLIKKDANFEGINITTYMRQAVLSRAQDAIDYRDAVKSEKADQGQTVSRASIMKQLGMNENG